MNHHRITRLFPNASPSFIKANANQIDSSLPHPKSQRNEAKPLEAAVRREEKSICRPRVCFTLYRVQLLDPDNAAGSVKDLLDGLRHAHLIQGDEWYAIKLEVEQERVPHYKDEKTVIEIL